MFRLLLTAIAVVSILAPSSAQGTFAELRKQLDAERDALVRQKRTPPTFEDIQKLGASAAKRLEAFLTTSQGDDAANARLMLVNVWADLGKQDAAKAVLKGFDAATTPPLALAAAAEYAARLELQDLRTRFVDAAMAAKAPLEQRMALAIFLATRLVEPDRAEQLFTRALADSADDEARAQVLWYRATCLRAREDVEEDAWLKSLEELEQKFPSTYWGGIARDRRQALELKPGDAAIAFSGKGLDGQAVSLAALAGKVVLVEFWGEGADRAAPFVAKLRDEFAAKGLVIVGVAAFEDQARAEALTKSTNRSWPQLFDGRGLMTDAALRYGVERLPEFVLIDKLGKLALQNVWIDDPDGRAELRGAIERCVSDG